MIHCRTLGLIEIESTTSGKRLDIKGNKNRALFFYLARSPQRSRSREHLTGLLWANKPEEKARHSLREAVRVLRQQLGDNVLESDSEKIGLVGVSLSLDIDEFDALETDGDWRGAASLVGGEFLEGLSVKDAWTFEEWLASERALWRDRSTTALAKWCDQLLAIGKVAEAVEMGVRAQALNPGSGIAVQAAIRSLALHGDRAGALARFDTYLERLAEVGAEPDNDVLQLVTQVRQERAWHLSATGTTGTGKGAESRRAPLTGRETELSKLVTEWERCGSDSRATVGIIDGDSGAGKTRLSDELVARARLSHSTVATFRAVPGDLNSPQTGLLSLARGGLLDGPGLATASPLALGAFAVEIPEWADRFGISQSKTQAIESAITDVLRAITNEQPVLILVDDAQWCDSESLLALTAVVRDLAEAPLFLLLSTVPQPPREELDYLRSRVGRDIEGVTILLDRLPESALHELTRWALPDYSDDEIDRLTRRVSIDSAGLPLLAVEILHAIALGMDLAKTTGAWPQPFRTLSHTLPGDLPDVIVGAIRVGFRRLSKNAQRLLAAASVLDNPTPIDQLSLGTGLSGDELTDALEELEWQRWLSADARGYGFVARIVREIVARDMITEGGRLRILKASSASGNK